jgi:hypothetical protein
MIKGDPVWQISLDIEVNKRLQQQFLIVGKTNRPSKKRRISSGRSG